ncbi:MAG: hypothetical protein CME06_10015 [Gemmatimonadetes bacterium]|nr:hypothetical protein [Gemmatimonadota bacterium]
MASHPHHICGTSGRQDDKLFLDPEKVPEADRVLFVETGRNFFEENPRRPVAGVEGHWVGAVSEGWKFLRIPTPMGQDRELYDLAADPEEVDNRLASDPVIAKRLEGLMDAWIGGFDDTESSDRNPGLDGDTQRHLRSLGYMD